MKPAEMMTVREARAFVHAGLPRYDAQVRRKYQHLNDNAKISREELTNYIETLLNR